FPSPSLVPQRSTPEPAVDSQQSSDTIELTSPSLSEKLPTTRPPFHAPSSSRPTTSDGDRAAVLTFEPPTTRSPRKAPPRSKTPPASTPPPSPSKGKLLSPSKRAQRIAAAPFRPSIDAFWSPTMVNEWNDQYSPKKECLTSPRKKRFGDLLNRGNNESGNSSDNEAYPSPSTSPKKSPKKRDNAAAKRKDFEAAKHEIAEAFIRELDEHITDGKIAELAKETGGVKLVWSKRLNTTAGRANWRRDHIGKTLPDGTKVTTRFRHTASIELAEKVIDNEERLINILAHEWCHLANFMVSDIRDRPHGKEFQEWAVKTSRAFASRGVQVTTKHSYEIDYKYAWECEQCGLVYQRHSKSIDPKKVSCGACRSKLFQIKPKPRGGAASGYAGFVKENFATVKSENPGASHGVVMERLGKLYKERKAASATPSSSASIGDRLNGAVDDIAEALGVVVIDD
ncbi:MAG: SprT-like domain-containing protein, partial [Terriglobus roseus]|nr:SprT-like domain-containing protein [Terriglobus roseus]